MGAVLARRVLVLFVAAVMAVMMSMGPALATGGGNKKVTICHKGKNTLHIPKKAAKKHLKNHKGDYWGPCKKKTDHHHKGDWHKKNSWHR